MDSSDSDELVWDAPQQRSSPNEALLFESSTHAFPLPATLSKAETELERSVSLASGIALIVGVSIGSGIFASPGPVFEHAGSVGAALLVWIFAGVLAIAGGLCYAELGTMIPSSGGEHAYLLRGIGELPAFLFVWASATVARPGSLAIVCITCAEYACRIIFFGMPAGSAPQWLVRTLAAAVILLLSAVNAISSALSTLVQDVFTALKLLSLAFISAAGIAMLARSGSSLSHNFDHGIFDRTSSNPGDIALAIFSALWAYDGWNNLNMVTGELINPSKNLPKAIIGAPLIVIFCYIAANIAYFAVLPPKIVSSSTTIGMDFGTAVFGNVGGIIIPLIVVGSTCGAANAGLFTGSRLLLVSAQKGHAPPFLAQIHPSTRTPINAIALQAVFSIVFVFIGNFKSLVNFYSIIAWSFYLLTIISLLSLRMSEPYADRPFAVWLPIPILFSGVTVCLITFTVWEAPWETLSAAIFITTGIIIYYIGKRFGIQFQDFVQFCILALAACVAWIPFPNLQKTFLRQQYERHQDVHEHEYELS